MATTTEKYPIIQLLDNLNNPVSPSTQVDSIYEDPGTKNPIDLIYKYESQTLDVSSNLTIDPRTDGGKVIRQIGTKSSDADGNSPDEDIVNSKELYIVTDTWVGDGPNDASVYNVDNTLHVRKFSASELLSYWFEHDYLSKKAGSPIYFGTCSNVPSSVSSESATDTRGTSAEAYHPIVSGSGQQWYWGKTIDSNERENFATPVYKVVDFNSTNFFANDLYPRRGVINPSGEYIWFIIDNPNVTNVRLFGFSGEDSPQEIDITPINNMNNAWISTGKFGIDQSFNSGNSNGGDGLPYHIFVKYSEP